MIPKIMRVQATPFPKSEAGRMACSNESVFHHHARKIRPLSHGKAGTRLNIPHAQLIQPKYLNTGRLRRFSLEETLGFDSERPTFARRMN